MEILKAFSDKSNVVSIQSMANLTDTQKDEVSGSFVTFVLTKMLCKGPGGSTRSL